MFKKILFLLLLLCSSLSFAKSINSTLTVAPYNPSNWGYMAASVTINNGSSNNVGNATTLPVKLNDKISLTVFAMNAHPKLANSCQNISIQEKGLHLLLFELKGNWLIHCRYS